MLSDPFDVEDGRHVVRRRAPRARHKYTMEYPNFRSRSENALTRSRSETDRSARFPNTERVYKSAILSSCVPKECIRQRYSHCAHTMSSTTMHGHNHPNGTTNGVNGEQDDKQRRNL